MQQWNDVVRELEQDFGKATTDVWIRSLVVIGFDDTNLYLQAADHFQALWFEEHIRPRLKKRPLIVSGKKLRVHLKVRNEGNKNKNDAAQDDERITFTTDSVESSSHFSQFIPGKLNELPFRLITELAGFNPETGMFGTPALMLGELNPIYLYGAKGLGKTHLLMSLANALKNRGKRVLYAKAETFTDHVIKAYRSSLIDEFRKAYRNVDVLIIDDVHIFSKKSTTQEELFHTFNYLHTRGKQIIVTADCAPRSLVDVEERLVSRFEWGVSLALEKLSKDERLLLLKKRLEGLDFTLSDASCRFLIETFYSNASLIRATEAIILRIHVDAKLGKRPEFLTPDDLSLLLSDLIETEHRQMMTPEKLLSLVAKTYQVTPEDILGKSKTKECVIPRQVAMYLCRKELGLPYLRIGSIFSRDHSTVMSSVRLVTKAIEKQDKRIVDPLDNLQKLASSA